MITLTDNQQMCFDSFMEFVDKEVRPRVRELDRVDEYPLWMRDRMAELGLTRIVAPEEHGGLAETTQFLVHLVMEAAKVNNNLASLVNCSNNANKLLSFGNARQLEEFLPRILDEGRFMGMAYTEPSGGSDSRAIQTTARRDGEDWVINGSKTFISYRCAVGCWQVTAKTTDESGQEGVSLFLVDAAADGITYGTHFDKMGWTGSDTGEIFFNDCRVPGWALAGELGHGLRISLSTLANARLVIAARSVGYAEAAFEIARDYAAQRVAFGKTLNSFQAIRFQLAEMYAELQQIKSYVYAVAGALDAGADLGAGPSIAKLQATEAAVRICDRAMTICGGLGLVREFGLVRYYEDARVLTVGEGTSEVQKMLIYRDIAAQTR
jgi:alkylation response protein AidB-like acyl-CoA dehydrogenase